MLHDFFRRLDNACPWLARWLGGRLDFQLPAIFASVTTHIALLLMFAMFGYAAHTEYQKKTIKAEWVDTKLSDFATFEDRTALAEIDNTLMKPEAGAFAPTMAPLISDPVENPRFGPVANLNPPLPRDALSMEKPPVSMASAALTLPGAPRLDTEVSIQGKGAEHVGGVEGAVDRIAVEILRRLEKNRTLVVWAFDASGSLLAERQRLAKYIGGVYEHIGQLDRDQKAENSGLLSAVVAFGKARKVLTEPTADAKTIQAAIESVYLDETGVENTFSTVAEIARKFGKFQKDKNEYTTLCIVVTDEVGDDETALEAAIVAVKQAKMPVFVLGSAALFGRADGYMDYIDPKTKYHFRNVPVRQGPESLKAELIRLPFWYDGPQHDRLDSGFGPWALSRLAGASGGIYFVTRLHQDRVTFDPAGMAEYKPDWNSRDVFERNVSKDPLRQAVLMAAQITQTNLPPNVPARPPLVFPAADSPEFKERMSDGQEQVARIMYTVDEALPAITAVVKLRDHEKSRRWLAHYDLIRGRLLAMKLRCYEYNWACAKMKKDPQKFTNPKNNSWRLVPDTEVRSSAKAAEVAEEAHALLARVIKEHPGTPWALLAQREIKDPFGFKWVETHVPPPPKPNPNAAAAKKKNQNDRDPPKPPPLPKL